MNASLGFPRIVLLITIAALGCTAMHHQAMESPADISVRVRTPNPPVEVPVPTPNPMQPYDFQVKFEGIISHVVVPSGGRRAVVVNGNVLSMRHNGVLTVEKVNQISLRDLAGQPAHCRPHSGEPQFVDCSVRLRGVDMQILDQDQTAPQGSPIVIDRSFDELIPHLASRDALNGMDPAVYGRIDPSILTRDFPSSPVGAYFEIANAGTIVACPLNGHLGRFTETDGDPLTAWAQFGNTVHWSGRTAARATLFIRSLATNWKWEAVKLETSGPLIVKVENFPSDRRTTPEHWDLHGKLLPLATLSLVEDKRVHIECEGLAECFVCPTTSSFDVAGCSNSQWP